MDAVLVPPFQQWVNCDKNPNHYPMPDFFEMMTQHPDPDPISQHHIHVLQSTAIPLELKDKFTGRGVSALLNLELRQ